MRPRKYVILLAHTEESESLWKFVIENCGHYKVYSSTENRDITEEINKNVYDALLIEHPRNFDFYSLNLPYTIKSIGFGSENIPASASQERYVTAGKGQAERLLATLKIAVRRKRGPRKQKKEELQQAA